MREEVREEVKGRGKGTGGEAQKGYRGDEKELIEGRKEGDGRKDKGVGEEGKRARGKR